MGEKKKIVVLGKVMSGNKGIRKRQINYKKDDERRVSE